MIKGEIQKGRPWVGEGEVADFRHLWIGRREGVDAIRTVPGSDFIRYIGGQNSDRGRVGDWQIWTGLERGERRGGGKKSWRYFLNRPNVLAAASLALSHTL